jgi:hypothetical protein
VAAVLLRDAQSQFQLVRGKCFKRAHATGFQKAVTKSWSPRFFIFDCQKCDLFYWKEQPTAEFIEANGDQEHHKATRVVLTRARLQEPSAGAHCMPCGCKWLVASLPRVRGRHVPLQQSRPGGREALHFRLPHLLPL